MDWLRVFGMVLVFVIHSAEPFNPWDTWHVVNAERSKWLGELILFLAPWVMPLFMLLAGAGAWYSLGKRSNRQYLRERTMRIFLPFVVGVLLLVPPQVYAERRLRGQFGGSFVAFYPHFFDGIYPEGNFGWHHLWFLLFLFVFGLVTLPLFRFLRKEVGRRWIGRLARLCDRPGGLLFFVVPLIVGRLGLSWLFPRSAFVVADWSDRTLLLAVFIYGFTFMADPRFGRAIDAQWKAALGAGAVFSAGMFAYAWPGNVLERVPVMPSLSAAAFWSAYTLGSWCWLVALLGVGRRYLGFRNGFLERASEIVSSLYLVHQTVIVVIASYVVRWGTGPFAKFFVLATFSAVASLAACEMIRRSAIGRVMFGLKKSPTLHEPGVRKA